MLMNDGFTLDSFFKSVPTKTQNGLDKPVCFTLANVLLSYVNETTNLLGNLPFFKIHGNHVMAWHDSPCAISKYMLWVRGLVQIQRMQCCSGEKLKLTCPLTQISSSW